MRKLTYLLLALLSLVACSDDESFTNSPSALLTFSVDTVRMDTVFSQVPSAAKSFWVHNYSGDGLRCTSVRLERGKTSGFRVNVDGVDLSGGTEATDIEVRRKDSLRVFIELTSPAQNREEPTLLEDNLVFRLESGVEQKVNLNAYSWDATLLRNHHVTGEETFRGPKPIVVYGGLTVDSAATLHLAAGTTLYFHNDAALHVYGRLLAEGTAEENVVLRGDRIDNMFSYLPYDMTPGQWRGVRLYASSTENELTYTDIHSAFDGIVIDSCDASRAKLRMMASTIHNCQGYGLISHGASVGLYNSQFTNTLHDCVFIDGGAAVINNCTLAQFYPFDSERGAALRFGNEHTTLAAMVVCNSLITGYADDVLMGEGTDSVNGFSYQFDHCIIRTPKPETADSTWLTNIVYEDIKDTLTQGYKHFRKIDTDNLRYDFRIDSVSIAIGAADPTTALSTDRLGVRRDDKPDIGAYEFITSEE